MSFPSHWDVLGQFACPLVFVGIALTVALWYVVRGIRKCTPEKVGPPMLATVFCGLMFFFLTMPLANVSNFHVSPDDVRSLTITHLPARSMILRGEPLGPSHTIDDPALIKEFLGTLESATPRGWSGSRWLDGYRVEVNLDDGSVFYISAYKNTSGKRNAYVLAPHLDKDSASDLGSQAGQFTCQATYEWIHNHFPQP